MKKNKSSNRVGGKKVGRMSQRIKKLSERDSAYIRMLDLKARGELARMDLEDVVKIVARMYPETDRANLVAVARAWSSTDQKELLELAERMTPEVEHGLVHNKISPPEAIAIILETSEDPVNRAAAAAHRNAPPDSLATSAKMGGALEKTEALSNPNTPPRAVLEELESGEGHVKDAVDLRIRRMLREKED